MGDVRRGAAVAGLMAGALLLPSAALAAEPPVEAAGILDILGKAATFEVASSVLETGLFAAFYGAGVAGVPVVFVVSFVSSGALYIAHEMAWNSAAAADTRPADVEIVTAKSVTYRALSTARSFAVGTALGGGRLAGSAAYAVTVAVADTALYAAHEYAFAWFRGAWRPALIGGIGDAPVPAEAPLAGGQREVSP